jgi:hypothetical protein
MTRANPPAANHRSASGVFTLDAVPQAPLINSGAFICAAAMREHRDPHAIPFSSVPIPASLSRAPRFARKYIDVSVSKPMANVVTPKATRACLMAACADRRASLRSRLHLASLFEHDLFRKPVPIPDRCRGHAFRDHALPKTKGAARRPPLDVSVLRPVTAAVARAPARPSRSAGRPGSSSCRAEAPAPC